LILTNLPKNTAEADAVATPFLSLFVKAAKTIIDDGQTFLSLSPS